MPFWPAFLQSNLVSGCSGKPFGSMKKRSKYMSLSLIRRTAIISEWSTFFSTLLLKFFTANTKWSRDTRTCSKDSKISKFEQ